MKKIIAFLLIILSLFLVSCDIGAELESYSDQLMSQMSGSAGNILKQREESTDTDNDTFIDKED